MKKAVARSINVLVLLAVLAVSAWWFHFREPPARETAIVPAPTAVGSRPAMTVTAVKPTVLDWQTGLDADGSVAAWQEVSISPELGGFRIAEVLVNVGDRVAKGQTLATLSTASVANDLAQQTAAVAEARASLAEASANAARARKLQDSGAISAQQISQYLTAEQTARSRVQAAEARIKSEQLRMSQTSVIAPDDGVISVRAATAGALARVGEELFRLIRQGRLEWRAEVPGTELFKVREKQPVELAMPDGAVVSGRVRTVAPTIDPQTRKGIVYVDIGTVDGGLRAGMFARGRFNLGHSKALTVPAASVLVRDGFSYLFKLGADNRVTLAKIETGRRQGERIEVTEGLMSDETVVEAGVGFLADGDTVAVAQSIK
ncbi:MAG: efflux RND transporter periplasmic adaptor subunit [Lautropia sp.]|nr:efflux RND transporter periplasmic adaptor subunit [Lautropia sp.]